MKRERQLHKYWHISKPQRYQKGFPSWAWIKALFADCANQPQIEQGREFLRQGVPQAECDYCEGPFLCSHQLQIHHQFQIVVDLQEGFLRWEVQLGRTYGWRQPFWCYGPKLFCLPLKVWTSISNGGWKRNRIQWSWYNNRVTRTTQLATPPSPNY